MIAQAHPSARSHLLSILFAVFTLFRSVFALDDYISGLDWVGT